MITYIIIGAVLLVAILVALRFVHKLYPVAPLRVGSMVAVYMDGKLNRIANITHNYPVSIFIYDKLRLPVHYRGKFYAVGRTEDGHTLMMLGKRKYYILARVAEAIRKVANTPAYDDPADYSLFGDMPSNDDDQE